MAHDIERLIRPSEKHVLKYNGVDRTYLYYLPVRYDSAKRIPLVVVLHGGGGNAENALRMADMDGVADRENFITLYPDGSGKPGASVFTWNAGHCCGYAVEHNCDDVGYIDALIEYFKANYAVDEKRVYITGFSNGAMLAHRLGLELSEKVAAIAPVSGSTFLDERPAASPVSVLMIHGTGDEHAPYEGGKGGETRYDRVDPPVWDLVKYWVNYNSCSGEPVWIHQENYDIATYKNGAEGAEVIFYTIKGGKHAWPGGLFGLRYGNVDEPSTAISATEVIWKFFKSH